MMWRRFTGSNGSCGAGRLMAAARWIRSAGLVATVFVVSPLAGAAGYDGYAAENVDAGVMMGDLQPGREQSVMVGDGHVAAPYGSGEAAGTDCPPSELTGSSFGPAIINRMLGPACPRWTGQADVLLLWQGNVPATPLLTLQDPPNSVLLNGSQIPYVMGTGPRVALMFNIDKCSAIEANYFNAGNFSASRSIVAPAAGQMAWAALGNYNVGNIDDAAVSTSGRIQSLELNWRRYNGRSFTWLAGFRWIEWNDSLAMTDNWNDGTGAGIDTLNANTSNDLYGGQIGADAVLLTLFDTIRFNGVAKAGVYGNPNASATTTVGGDRIVPATYTATGSSTGFFGELGINGSIRLTEHLFWRAGYNFFWISGVATSLNQLQAVDLAAAPPVGPINLGGSVFLQGVNTGIELVW